MLQPQSDTEKEIVCCGSAGSGDPFFAVTSRTSPMSSNRKKAVTLEKA
jgi:hypothetical protein